MATEISVELFEKNAKIYNKKGLRRRYTSFGLHESEYVSQKPLGATSKYVMEVVIDKEYATLFRDFLVEKNFKIIGSNNHYHLGNMIKDYHDNLASYASIKDRMEAIEKDYKLMVESTKDYEEIENDDVKFYFLPYNDSISTICEFIEEEKNNILEYAKTNDITILLNLKSYTNMVKGFIGFNFLDAEAKEDQTIEYSANIVLNVDIAQRMSVFAAGIQLSGLAKDEEDLEIMGCHILAENLKYTK